jgi:bifunctional non-homologous end joining protein LigD
VRVEDHPLEYAGFEGHIPENNYGAGAVIVWDRGVWIPIGDAEEGLEKGKLLFELKGYKLRGKWTLIKTKRGPKDWLLIKERDNWVSDKGTDSLPADSILSGLTVQALKEGSTPEKSILNKLKRLKAPKGHVQANRLPAMLAQTGLPFSKPGWLFEIKYDGYRLIVSHERDKAQLFSRTGNDLTSIFPEIADAVRALPFQYVVMDGEAIVHDSQGLPSFSQLQKRGRLTRRADVQRAAIELPATLYVFDLIAFNNHDLRGLPLHTRKMLLKGLLPSVGPVRYTDHIEEHGEAMYTQVQTLGLEGMVAKKADSRYQGGRSSAWIKVSVEHTDDFAVVGYTNPKGSQPGFGALLLAQCVDDEFIYAGRAGSGFSKQDLTEITAQLSTASKASPPRNAPEESDTHWVKPKLVAEIKFKQRTRDGVLRQPVFLRLREDKPIRECVWQSKQVLPEPTTITAPATADKVVNFTNKDKLFWPDDGYTKGDLITYYEGISEWLLPYLKDRPVVLTRYPDGIDSKSFFQKDAPSFVPGWIRIERMWSEQTQREVRYFVVEDLESLLYIVNMGTIPLHIWSSRTTALEKPDWCILDLDPKGAPFGHVVKIAKKIRTLCEQIELPCFVKTSGSTGLHVLVPLGHRYTYDQSRSLGELLARVVVANLSEIATVTRAVSERGGRVYIDYLQNGRGRLLASPFSVRPLPKAPVSMPLRWSEVTSRLDIRRYTIKNAAKRMRSLKEDPLRKVMGLSPNLTAALERLGQKCL